MYERIKALFLAGRLTLSGLDRAVALGWISAEQRAGLAAQLPEVTV